MLQNNQSSSPVILLLKVADGDEARATANCKLIFFGGPFHTAGGAIDPEDDQSGLPNIPLQGPHISVTVSATGDDAVAFRSPVATCQAEKA